MAESIGLAEAAQRLKCSWARCYNLVLSGHIHAERASNGRWRVSLASLESYRRRTAGAESKAPAHAASSSR
jgi:predicted site-specific integrase-resolvase